MMPLPPLPPMPPREFFRSEAEYLAARNNYVKMKKDHDEMAKSQTAFVLVFVGLFVGGAALFGLFLLYTFGGLKSIGYVAAAIGLFWVAYEQVRSRL